MLRVGTPVNQRCQDDEFAALEDALSDILLDEFIGKRRVLADEQVVR